MKQVVAALLTLTAILGGAVVYLFATREPSQRAIIDAAIDDPSVRREAVRELMKRSGGVWDSYGDADVGRILLPELEGRSLRGVEIESNAFGMREGWYALKKPADTTRVVLLGDSYVFGSGGKAEDRLGVFLESYLREGMQPKGKLEVLHIGLSSWNIIAECAYVRRQLSDMDPDLVIHLTIDNDLEDVAGVRGFGEMASFSPQARELGNSRVGSVVPSAFAGRYLPHHLAAGADWESRRRYARAAADITELEERLEESGSAYLLVLQWNDWNGVAQSELAANLEADQVALISKAFHFDEDNWIQPHDRHWNRLGNERIAKLLYGMIQARDLLPGITLTERDDAMQAIDTIHNAALEEIEERGEVIPDCHPRLTCPPEDLVMTSQVYAGLDKEGNASAHVSVVLANGGDELTIRGASLDRPELNGVLAHVFVEGEEVGTIELGQEARFPFSFQIPEHLANKPLFNVRILADDWVYGRVYDGLSRAFRLEALEVH